MNLDTSPQPPALPSDPFADEGTVPDEVIRPLVRTKGWLVFFAVFLWIVVTLFAVFAAGMLFAGTVIVTIPRGGTWDTAFVWVMGGGYAVFALLFVLPALRLSKCASRIGLLMYTRRKEDLAAALEQQRAFWKAAGITVIACIASYFLMMGVVMYTVFNAASRPFPSSPSPSAPASPGPASPGP